MAIRLNHAPTPGHYAHVASSGLTDSVVLDRFGGRPSLLVLEIDETPVLAWMMHGHEDEAELWVYVPLVADEAELMLDDPPLLVAKWLADRSGREAFVAVAVDGILLVSTLWTVPDVAPVELPSAAARAIREEPGRALQEDLPSDTRRALVGGQHRFQQLLDVA